MLFRHLSLFFLLTFSSVSYGQAPPVRHCASHEKLLEAIAKNPSLLDVLDQTETVHDPASAKSIVTIPVVVHVIYRTVAQNISTAQVNSQIIALNKDYRMLNGDTALVPGPFKGLAADCEIEFCLATKDPQGLPTTGITRTQTTTPNIGDTDLYYSTANGGHDAWPRDKYLNIWVCEIDQYTLGFAYPPGAASPAFDGVVINFFAFGTFGTAEAPFNRGRTATHEIGHFFNLRHIWGDMNSCSATDFVADTPPQKGENYGCKSFPHEPDTCNTPYGDMYMNYMDYVNDNCMQMFTHGQKTRMHNALNSTLGDRSSLLTSDACGPVGIAQHRRDRQPINLYPNPASSQIHVSLPELESELDLYIINMKGQVLLRYKPLNVRETLNIESLPEGIYTLIYGGQSTKLAVIK